MLMFPDEIIVRIYYFFEHAVDFVSLSRVCSSLYQIGNDERVCKILVSDLLGIEKYQQSLYQNLILYLKHDENLSKFCINGNYKFFRLQRSLTKVRMLLIECCRYDNPQTFVTICEKIRKRHLNPFIVKKLIKVINKSNSLKVAHVFFTRFLVTVSPNLFKNENVFEIFLENNQNYDFLKLIYYLCKTNALNQFKQLILRTKSNEPLVLQKFINHIIVNICCSDFLQYLLETLPIEIFKTRRCDVLSKLLSFGMFNQFLNYYSVFESEANLDYSVLSMLLTIKCCYESDILEQLFIRYPDLKISLTKKSLIHIILSGYYQSGYTWHKSMFLVISRLNSIPEVVVNLHSLIKQSIFHVKVQTQYCLLRMLHQPTTHICDHCQRIESVQV